MSQTVLRLPDLIAKLRLARSTIYDKLDPRSPRHDPRFPTPLRLGPRAVGWLEQDIERWLAEQAEQARR